MVKLRSELARYAEYSYASIEVCTLEHVDMAMPAGLVIAQHREGLCIGFVRVIGFVKVIAQHRAPQYRRHA